VIHPIYLSEVKSAAESKEPLGPLKVKETTLTDQSFRLISDDSCPMIRA
jgi:hypothetical protein